LKNEFDGEILSNIVFSQIDEHLPYGGVVPEIASRSHVESLGPLIDKALNEASLKLNNIDGIAATAGPGLVGGLIVGLTTAKGISLGAGIPLVGVNHLEGHALTPLLTNKVSFPYVLLLISGGHTQLILVKNLGEYIQLGTTLDDAVGEAFDKAAKFLGLGYPGGPALEKISKKGSNVRFNFPRPLLKSHDCNFSFSGLKTSLIREVKEIEPLTENDLADIASSYQQAIIDCLREKSSRAISIAKEEYKDLNINYFVAAGGVASNKAIGKSLNELALRNNMEFVAPPIKFCTDNAAMIAWAGGLRLLNGQKDSLEISVKSRWPLNEMKINGGMHE
jgi:N6-L-threonylcarbamoyladenine synthase